MMDKKVHLASSNFWRNLKSSAATFANHCNWPILILAYLPGIVVPTLWSDDYAAIFDNQANSIHMLRDGRPISAFLLFLSFELIKRFDIFIIILKLLALIGIFEAANQFLLFFDKSKSKHLKIIISISFCLPAFQVSIHWVHMWLTPWITFLVIYSFRNHFLQNRFLLFVSVLAIVLLTYQSIVGWIFILYSLKLLYSNSLTRSNLRLYPTMMICFFISLILASFCSITFLRGFGYIEFNERVRLITFSEIPSKVFWFVTRPVVIVFRFFQIVALETPS